MEAKQLIVLMKGILQKNEKTNGDFYTGNDGYGNCFGVQK